MIEKLKVLLPQITDAFDIKTLALFGSYADGTAKEHSDIDLLVEFKGYVGWSFFDLKEFLENSLQKKVDLVTPNAIKPSLRKSIYRNIIFLKNE